MSGERFKTNPFLEGMIIPIKGKQVRLSKLGRDDNVLINQSTGEVHGTHVTTYKPVDSEQFVKLFTANVAMTFDLQSAGIKALTVVIWTLQNHAMAKDEIALDQIVLDDFLEAHQDRKPPMSLSIATLKRGIAELEKAQIIAKTVRKGWYFINPNFIFNGDRIAFTTVIERVKRNRDPNTIDLLEGKTDAERERAQQE
ncbi:replication/maintenance protein RepL [Massilia sp. TN1-12]|uniref:replication/maintenance protein RepL n=1 Tax=Massilia paldalensis TaxID=3377675 RepID=UPI00384FF6C4